MTDMELFNSLANDLPKHVYVNGKRYPMRRAALDWLRGFNPDVDGVRDGIRVAISNLNVLLEMTSTMDTRKVIDPVADSCYDVFSDL